MFSPDVWGAAGHAVLLTRTSPALRPRTLGHLQDQLQEHGVLVLDAQPFKCANSKAFVLYERPLEVGVGWVWLRAAELAAVTTVPKLDAVGFDVDQDEVWRIDAGLKPPVEILGPVLGERGLVADQRSVAADCDVETAAAL
jgi:hypothetical protein